MRVDVLKNAQALFALENPAIDSMTAVVAAGVVVALRGRDPEGVARFEDEKLRAYLGMGAG